MGFWHLEEPRGCAWGRVSLPSPTKLRVLKYGHADLVWIEMSKVRNPAALFPVLVGLMSYLLDVIGSSDNSKELCDQFCR